MHSVLVHIVVHGTAFFYVGIAVLLIDFCIYFLISFCGYLGPVKLYRS